MSNHDTVRGPHGSKRTSENWSGASRPRVPSGLNDEVAPSDSASNAPHRRQPSGSHKVNGSKREAYEKRVERTKITTTDTVHVRRKSSIKTAHGDVDSHERHKDPTKRRVEKEVVEPQKEKQPLPPWKPQASLIPHTSSPLASRIALPPTSALLPPTLQPKPLHELSLEDQEAAMLEDLLFVFMGYEGQYIRFPKRSNPHDAKERLAGPTFKILAGLDPSLKDLTATMIQTATHYIAVDAFVEVQSQEDFGTINHALCASIRKLLKEYLILIAQMETQILTNESFTLHVLHLHILPTSHMMAQLHTLAQEMLLRNKILQEEHDSDNENESDIEHFIQRLESKNTMPDAKKIVKGGNVLRLLTERLSHMAGDPAARKLLEGLLRDASRPYMVMLNEWIHRGAINDPHAEFAIREQKSFNRENLEEDFIDQYWDKRYTIRENDVPPQLEAVKDKVLLAGKYLNVVRECGGVDISKIVEDLPLTFEDPRFLNNINDAYAHANSSLLKLLLTTHELSARLRSIKHYFFLDRADFFASFLFLSNAELKKAATDVNVEKLQSLLDLVLRQPGTVAAQDPFKEDVKIHINPHNLTKFLMTVVNVKGLKEGEDPLSMARPLDDDDPDIIKMTGFDALEFKYKVPFPLSLVISSKTIVRYQILFRYVLSIRHIEELLVTSWQDHSAVSSWTWKSKDRRVEMWKRKVWNLRARMLNFVQQFLYYCTAEVIEPNWTNLMKKVSSISEDGEITTHTVDRLMSDHVDFLDTCLKECMLMNPKLLKVGP